MPQKPTNDAQTSKPAGEAERQAARQSTKDGLKKSRESHQTRDEIRDQKAAQGQPNSG